MKKIMIYAYTNINLGDDLFIKVLCERYPHTQFILQGEGYKKIFKSIPNLKCYTKEFFIVRVINKLLRVIGLNKIQLPKIKELLLKKRVNGFVYIGGSMFMENEWWEENLKLLNSRVKGDRPFYMIGCNFGPYSSQQFYIQHKQMFQKCKDICFREEYSYQLFRDMSNIRKADDVVFGLRTPLGKRDNKVIISVIDLSNREELKNYNKTYIDKIVQLCKYIIKQGDQVVLMSFCEVEGDGEAIDKVTNLLEEEYRRNVIKSYYRGNIDEMLEIFKNSKLVIATRFHSMILGFNLGIPVFPIIYSKKMKNVLDDIEFKGISVDIRDIKSINVEDIYNSISTNLIDVSQQKQGAEKQFEKLDIFLHQKKD